MTINQISKILLVRQDKIGDLVLITPAIRGLKEANPNMEIHVLASEYAAPVLENNPHLSGVILWKPEVSQRMIQQLREEGFDAAVLFFPTWKVSWSIFRAGIPVRIGAGVRPYWFLFTHCVPIHRSRHEKSEWEYNLEVLKPLIELPCHQPEVFLSEGERRWAKQQVSTLPRSKGVVGLYVGGGGEIRWPLKGFLELGDLLREEDFHPLFLWGKGEENLAEEIEKKGFSVAPPTTIRELTALLSVCSAVVTNNTGPMHIAAALNRPLVQIFDPRLACSPKRWGHYGKGRRVITPPVPPCKRCSSSCVHFNCMEKIDPKQVFQAVKDVVSETYEKR